jgi:hypothetical protein
MGAFGLTYNPVCRIQQGLSSSFNGDRKVEIDGEPIADFNIVGDLVITDI